MPAAAGGRAGGAGVPAAAGAGVAGRFFALQLRDETTVRREIWDKCGEDTLRGLFLQELRREYDGGDDETRRRIELAARFGVAAMDNREV